MSDKKRLSYWVFLAGIIAIIIGAVREPYFETMLIGKATLTGTISSCERYTHREIQRQGRSSHEVVVTELVFYLVQHDRKFAIDTIVDIHEPLAFHPLNHELQQIRRADSIKVFILKTDAKEYEPHIIKIEADGRTIISKENYSTGMAKSAIPLLFIGIALMILGIAMRKKDIVLSS